jgi:hypothetical protein
MRRSLIDRKHVRERRSGRRRPSRKGWRQTSAGSLQRFGLPDSFGQAHAGPAGRVSLRRCHHTSADITDDTTKKLVILSVSPAKVNPNPSLQEPVYLQDLFILCANKLHFATCYVIAPT